MGYDLCSHCNRLVMLAALCSERSTLCYQCDRSSLCRDCVLSVVRCVISVTVLHCAVTVSSLQCFDAVVVCGCVVATSCFGSVLNAIGYVRYSTLYILSSWQCIELRLCPADLRSQHAAHATTLSYIYIYFAEL